MITLSANLSAPDVIASEIVDDLEAALEQFREIENDSKGMSHDFSSPP